MYSTKGHSMNNFISVAKNLTKYCLILASCLYGYAAVAGVETNGYYKIDDKYYLVRNVSTLKCYNNNKLTITQTNTYFSKYRVDCIEFEETLRRCWEENTIICKF